MTGIAWMPLWTSLAKTGEIVTIKEQVFKSLSLSCWELSIDGSLFCLYLIGEQENHLWIINKKRGIDMTLPKMGRKKQNKKTKCAKCNKTFEINQDEIIVTGKRKTISCPNCGEEQTL